jgi:SAM-dependent methyltransferase
MASAEVGQWQVLNQILAEDLSRFQPHSLAVIGCATGNGFEHIDPRVTKRVTGIDVNPRYLALLRERHQRRLAELELIAADVLEVELRPGSFDLVHTALIFEYLDPAAALARIAPWIRPGGMLTVVLQQPSTQSSPVTPTPYLSLRALGSILRLVDPEELRQMAFIHGLEEREARRIELKQGKSFHLGRYSLARSLRGRNAEARTQLRPCS